MTKHTVHSEEQMIALGAELAKYVGKVKLICLEGPLGAGKTTLTRGLLRALGHQGTVKSPTYALVEHYEFPEHTIHHFDFYRLTDPQALFDLAFEDYLDDNATCIIEWPERVQSYLPADGIYCRIDYGDQENARTVTIEES